MNHVAKVNEAIADHRRDHANLWHELWSLTERYTALIDYLGLEEDGEPPKMIFRKKDEPAS